MQNDGASPDVATLVHIIKACGSLRAINKGKEIHDDIISKGLLHDNVVLGNAFLNMYARCGSLDKVQEVLVEIKTIWNIASWNTVIAGYCPERP